MFGARVRVRVNGAERVLEIVGGDEADPGSGRIAFSAPLARALIGAGAGDEVAFGTATVEVVEIIVDKGDVSAPDQFSPGSRPRGFTIRRHRLCYPNSTLLVIAHRPTN